MFIKHSYATGRLLLQGIQIFKGNCLAKPQLILS